MTTEEFQNMAIERFNLATEKFEKIDEFQKMAIEQFRKNDEFQRVALQEFRKNAEFQKMAIEQFNVLASGQEKIWEKLFSTSEDVEYLKKKVDHIEVRLDNVYDSVTFIEERTRRDDDALAANFFKLEQRVTKLEAQRA